MDRPTLRFAPSPNGYLHRGHAYSALLNRSLAEASGGTMLLRLEDIDRERCRPAFADAIEDDLRWLGLNWPAPVRRQSAHLDIYRAALDGLVERRLAYPCFCTRGLILAAVARRAEWPADPDGAPLYPGLCKALDPEARRARLASGAKPAWRLDMDRALAILPARLDWWETGEDGAARRVDAEPARWGDALIARKDVPTSYHLSVVVDDAVQGVSDVVRGRDLFAATALHRALQGLLGLPAPRYRHHRLVLDEAGHKLSKSRGATALRDLRARGLDAEALKRDLGL